MHWSNRVARAAVTSLVGLASWTLGWAQQPATATAAQNGNLVKDYPSPTDSPAEVRAWVIRKAIVDQFGTAEQKETFNHPKPPSPFTVPPVNSWQIVFAFAQLRGFRNMADTPGGGKTTKQTKMLSVLSLLQKIVGDIPGVDAAQAASASAASAAARHNMLARQGRSRSVEAEAIVQAMLPPADLEEYKSGSYAIKASKLFKAGYTTMERQAIPDALVLSMCDAPAPFNGKRGESARSGMKEHFPHDKRFDESIWSGFTLEQQWQAVTDGFIKFLKQASEYMRDPKLAELFFGTKASELGVADLTEGEIVLSVLGPDAHKTYENSPGERTQLKAAALAILDGLNLARPILIGDISGTADKPAP